ncbi:hypothetical protein Tco_1018429 [Tanacetum coccineum]|uniref:Uncharacterized protein n=1 Tax=Tanacetum coccineum TaxID=301880 RepID=A0ABQ5FVD6_9ASTR
MKPWGEGGLKDKSKDLSSSLCQPTAENGGRVHLTCQLLDTWALGYKGLGPLQDPTAATISSITITNGDGMPRMRTFRETVSPESSSTNGRSSLKSLCDGWRNMVLSR